MSDRNSPPIFIPYIFKLHPPLDAGATLAMVAQGLLC